MNITIAPSYTSAIWGLVLVLLLLATIELIKLGFDMLKYIREQKQLSWEQDDRDFLASQDTSPHRAIKKTPSR